LSGTSYEPNDAIFDRLELVKGPSSVVYGVSSAGGLVNYVTKSATADTPDYLLLRYGSWNAYRVEGQIAGALTSSGSLRGIGVAVHEEGDSFITGYSQSSNVVYGGLNWSGHSLSAFVHGGYERYTRTSIDGVPTEADGSPAPLPRWFLIGSNSMEVTSSVWHAEGNVTWHVNDALDLSLKGNLRQVLTTGLSPYSFGLDKAGNLGLAMQDFNGGVHANDYAVGGAGIYRFDSLGLANSFVSVSAMYQADIFSGHVGQGLFKGPDPTDPFAGSVNIAGGQAAVENAFNVATTTGPVFSFDTRLKTLTFSAQGWVELFRHLSVLAGASYSKPKIAQNYGGNVQDFDSRGQPSYRGGLVFEFVRGGNAYLSYSQSFNPQTELDVNFNVLPPIRAEQYEGGLKYRPVADRILLTAAVFQIKQKNQGQFDTQVDGLDRYRAVGELTHKGFELEAVGRVGRSWQVNAGYAYLDPTVTQDSDPSIVGMRETFLPRQTASAFVTYTLNQSSAQMLSMGTGARYVGDEATSYDGSTRHIAGYTIADAMIGYDRGRWTLQVNAHNLFNRHYLINNYDTLFYGNTVGTPFNVSATVRYDFGR